MVGGPLRTACVRRLLTVFGKAKAVSIGSASGLLVSHFLRNRLHVCPCHRAFQGYSLMLFRARRLGMLNQSFRPNEVAHLLQVACRSSWGGHRWLHVFSRGKYCLISNTQGSRVGSRRVSHQVCRRFSKVPDIFGEQVITGGNSRENFISAANDGQLNFSGSAADTIFHLSSGLLMGSGAVGVAVIRISGNLVSQALEQVRNT